VVLVLTAKRNHFWWSYLRRGSEQVWPSDMHPGSLYPQYGRYISPIFLQDTCRVLWRENPHWYSARCLCYRSADLFGRDGASISPWSCHCGHELCHRIRATDRIRCPATNKLLQRLETIQSPVRNSVGLCSNRLDHIALPPRVRVRTIHCISFY